MITQKTYTYLLVALCLLLQIATTQAQQVSQYVKVKDGTRLAMDVYFPENKIPNKGIPVLFEFTRYWRGYENPKTGKRIPSLRGVHRHFLKNGYALAIVDVRGSGASFGQRPTEYSPKEVRDAYDVVDWVAKQPWCNGKVGAFGTSYTGTTAELLAATQHPAVKAVIPGWSDFDLYHSPVRPYGTVASAFIKTWSDLVGAMDHNDVSVMRASIRRVGTDKDGSLLKQAIASHKNNPNVYQSVINGEFRDQKMGEYTYEECSPIYWRKKISESKIPMLVLSSWLDAGTMAGTLQRFQYFKNPQKVIIMAGSHGGRAHGSPYEVGSAPLPHKPSTKEQFKLRTDFFDYYLKGKKNGVDQWPALKYYNMGEEQYKTTQAWPIKGTERQKWYFNNDLKLSPKPVKSSTGNDTYQVDFGVTTGKRNRWMTQMGQPIVNLHQRQDMDKRMLTYTSTPLTEDMQITGNITVNLEMASSTTDGLVVVYLEDVDENGQSRYITEGGLRLIHRKLSKNPYFKTKLPYHSFTKADAKPMAEGQKTNVQFKMWATSVLIKKGHRLRIAITGADKDMFDRIPKEGTPTYTFFRNAKERSFVEIPVVR
ncbi:MAG TPA: hypothetical protein DCS93_37185 [Microscillaceae bacterium]|nr:hypothetical protein [Microscillaceae bacterium]